MRDVAVFVAGCCPIVRAWILVLELLGWDAYEAMEFNCAIFNRDKAGMRVFNPAMDVLMLCCTADAQREIKPFTSFIRYLRDTEEVAGIRLLIMTYESTPFAQAEVLKGFDGMFNSTPSVLQLPWLLGDVVNVLSSIDSHRIEFRTTEVQDEESLEDTVG